MRFGVCLHAAAVTRSALPLHQSDRRVIALALTTGAEVVVLETVGQRGTAPHAAAAAFAAGATRVVRLVDPALAGATAQAIGFAVATALDALQVDLVLFGGDADPDGVNDVPACVAHHMSAIYLDDVLDVQPSSSSVAGSAPTASSADSVELTVRGTGWIRRARVPLNAVLGIAAPDLPVATGGPPAGKAAAQNAVQVITLAELNIDPALVRGRSDRGPMIDAAARPLVTLQSGAAIATLLRR
ncbi:MAG: hypothetical protein ABJA82_05770 [Myxococcales bacterium]